MFKVVKGFANSAAVLAKDSKIAKHGRIRCSCGDHLLVNRLGFSELTFSEADEAGILNDNVVSEFLVSLE